MNTSDEQLIADLSASLRQALDHIDGDKVPADLAFAVASVTTEHYGKRAAFNRYAAEHTLKAASARLATIQPKRPGLMVQLSMREAEKLSDGLSDILCWTRGFIAARPDDLEAHPMGVDAVRATRGALVGALAEARGEQDEELPF